MDRRAFLRGGGQLAATATLVPGSAVSARAEASSRSGFLPGAPASRGFPPGFRWGCATASYQVEGAVMEQGRGQSIWDKFSHAPGNTHNGDTGDIADDHFHRFKEDIALMKALGVKAYRFSIAWSRVYPDGVGSPNPLGLDFYQRLLDELLNAGIEPFCTLYHWDLPQALEDRFGGWQSRDTCKAFADYCTYTVGKLADRLSYFMTMNEMSAFVGGGYGDGHSAPGLKLDSAGVAGVSHNVVLAHGMAVNAIRASGRAGTRVGIPANAVATTPVIETPEHIQAAKVAFREENAAFLTVIMEGKYSERYLRQLGKAAPKHTHEELALISTPLDFLGLNIYTPTYIRAAAGEAGYEIVAPSASYPRMGSDWLKVGPEAMYWVPKFSAEAWGLKEIYITENGCSADDQISRDGMIYDSDRVMYLRNYLTQLQRATQEGIPVKGYFVWSLLDNFEWASGYSKRFGLVHVNYQTQTRTPKLSYDFYRAVIARGELV